MTDYIDVLFYSKDELKTAAKFFKKTAKFLEKHKWTRGRFKERIEGQAKATYAYAYCAVGAAKQVDIVQYVHYQELANMFCCKKFDNSLMSYNDYTAKRKRDVVKVFNDISKELAEKSKVK